MKHLSKTILCCMAVLVPLSLTAQRVSIHATDAKVSDILQQIQSEYGYSFSISFDALDMDKEVSLSLDGVEIGEAMSKVFAGQEVEIKVNGKIITVMPKPKQTKPAVSEPAGNHAPAPVKEEPRNTEPQKASGTAPENPQNQPEKLPSELRGRMVDENGQPLIGGGVMSRDGKRGGVTDIDGNFEFKLLPGDESVVFTYFGYENREIKIADFASLGGVVQMSPDTSIGLDEAVVIGYGSQRKEDLTGSVVTVKMADIENTISTSVDNALQGRIAGVDIMSTGGDPGSASSIRIRGSRSVNASNEPLIVVDGVMDAVSDISDVEPSTIESISVLKDASSTAIYGSRGANGVILITTKKAVNTKPSITANLVYGVSAMARGIDVMSAEQFIQYRNDNYTLNQYLKGNANPNLHYYSLSDYPNTTNWIEEITRIAQYRSASLSVNEKVGQKLYYWASAAYTDEEGIIKATAHRRFTANAKFFRSMNDWLDVTLSLSAAIRTRDQNKITISGSDQVNGAIYLTPLMGRMDNFNPLVDSGYYINSPAARYEYVDNLEKSYSRTDALKFTAKPVQGLVLNANLTSYYLQIHRYRFWPSYMPGYVNGEGAYSYRNEWDRWALSSELTGTWKKEIRKRHYFDLMAGYTASNITMHNLTLSGQGIVSDENKWNALSGMMSKSNYSTASSTTLQVKQSVLARANYNYKGRYYLTLTGRADGSSNFSEGNKWGFFPSGAVKWNIKKERFMLRVPWVSNLEVRASVGLSGNDAVGSYLSHAAYGYTTGGYVFDGTQQVAYYPSRIENPDLTWEKTTMYNVAIEGAVLNNRIRFTLESYDSHTRDLLIWLQTPRQSGYSSRMANIGRTRNQGVELSIETRNIERRRFGWTTTFTISHNDQLVEDIGAEAYVPLITDKEGYMIYGYMKGYPLNSLWGFQYGGVWHSSEEFERNEASHTYASFRNSYDASDCLGHSRFVDVNHDGVLDMKDRIYLGQADPVVQGGLQNTFHIGKAKLSVYLAYSIGGKIFNYSELFMAGSSQSNQYTYMLNSWHYTRPDSNLPRANDNYRLLSSSFQVHDASYLRLKSASFTWPFSFKTRAGRGIKGMDVTLSGENLWLWAPYNGFDPDVSSSGSGTNLRRVDMNAQPRARTVTMSVKLKI